MHLAAMIERVWTCTWRPWSNEMGGVHGGNQSRGGSSGGRCNGCWHCIHLLTRNCVNVENWVQKGLPRYWLRAGDSRCWDDVVHSVCSTQCMLYLVYAVLGVCCTRCMLYSVYAVLGVCCTRCSLLFMAWRDSERWLIFVFLGDGRVEDEKERDERTWDKSSGESRT